MNQVLGLRGGHVETSHRLHAAIVRPDGALVASVGDPRLAAPLRSTAKPIQAQALFLSGAGQRFGFSAEELALVCASHQGTERHVALAASILSRLGLDEGALSCGAHAPLDDGSRVAHIRGGGPPSPLHNNCSGKHAGMLASALALGAPTDGYLDPDHPLQRLIRKLHEQLAGTPHLEAAVDGCSAPTWVLGLHRLARMYAQLAAPAAAPPMLQPGLAAVGDAMRAFPGLVAGEGVIDTLLMRTVPGLLAKRGAAGCYAMALRDSPHGPLGVALKIADGSGEARTPAILAVLEGLGALGPEASAALAPLRTARRLNWRGLVVGRYEARVDLDWVAPSG
ncbi:MAG: asparaginase [Proteobacteria bacterium]|nr:MAG: asparaginase [Pseudomonadota bacterium]